MSDILDTKLFKGKTFSNLLEEIYDNSIKKEKRIKALISELSPLITDIEEAAVVVPLIKEYMEVAVKNDEHLIKMATIVQRVLTSKTTNTDNDISNLFSQEELSQLQELSQEVAKKENKK